MAKRNSPPTPVNAQPRLKPTRESDEAIRARGLTPFLRPEHVIDGEWLKLTGFNAIKGRDTDDEQIICEVENEHGHTYSLGVRDGSPDHRILHRTLGTNPKRWAGGVKVTIANGRTAGAKFVNVAEADTHGPVWDGPAPRSDNDREPGDE